MISLLIFLILIGAVLYIVQLLPIDGTIKRIIYVVVIVFIAIYALQMLAPGTLGNWPRLR
jgi:hypothetical protein